MKKITAVDVHTNMPCKQTCFKKYQVTGSEPLFFYSLPRICLIF